MIKIVASMSKKVPIPGLDYSSQSFMAGLEVEVSDGATADKIKERIHEVYTLLESSIDAEVAARGQLEGGDNASPAQQHNRFANDNGNGNRRQRRNGNGNGNRHRKATEAQVKAIFAIANSTGLSRHALLDQIQVEFGAGKPEDLTIKEASQMIESLKSATG